MRASGSDAGARAAFDRLVRKIDDGHVALDWPKPGGSSIPDWATLQDAPGLCAAVGYRDEPSATGVVATLPGYEPLRTSQSFQAGTVPVSGHRISVLRMEVFLPNRKLCVDAIQKLKIPIGVPCGDSCQEMIDVYAYNRRRPNNLRLARHSSSAAKWAPCSGHDEIVTGVMQPFHPSLSCAVVRHV